MKRIYGKAKSMKTKIIATLGPVSSSAKDIKRLVDAGVDVLRLNFSHGNLAGHGRVLEAINEVRQHCDHAIGVIGDLCGPKIRVGKIEDGLQELIEGEHVVIASDIEVGTGQRFGSNYPGLIDDVSIGQRLLINDGLLELRVLSKKASQAVCEVIVGGVLKSKKGINLPDTSISIPAITERDWECVDWAIANGVDYLALSFVQTAEEVLKLKQYLADKDSRIKVISKIEKPAAIDNLEQIVMASDAVLVARGDLGVEMELCEVPLLQKQITRMCRRLGKPVIVATQMLESMTERPVATRAEVSDVANAMMDFADAVMLSGETAVGRYPIQAVETMEKIGVVTERYMDESTEMRPPLEVGDALADRAVIARSIAQMVDEIDVKLVAAWCDSGQTTRMLSKARIDVPIVAFADDEALCRQISLHYGVIAIFTEKPSSLEEFAAALDKVIVDNGYAGNGQRIVLLPGVQMLPSGASGAIILHTIGGKD